MIRAKQKAHAGPIDPAKLKGYVERIEAVEAEEADYKATKKDLYVEVKAAGLRPKMVRKIVKERKKTEADKEDEAELELYRAALAMPGATFRSVAKDLGVSRSTLHRLVPRNKNGTSPSHDAEGVGEIIKPEDGDDGIAEPRNPHDMQANDPAPQGSSPGAPESVEVTSLAGPPVPEGGEGTGTHSDDDLAPPDFLRGPSPANRSLRP